MRLDYGSAEVYVAAGPYDALSVFSGYEDGLYLADQNRLWQIGLTDGSLEPIVAWQDIYLKAEYVKAVRRQENGSFLLYVLDTLENENYWVSLDPVPASELGEKRELVLGVAGSYWYNTSLASNIEGVLLAYHRTHPECHITFKEYSQNAVMNFQMELLKGEGPDILLERQTFFDMEELAGKGAVVDLAPYLAETEGVSAEDMLPGILELATKDGMIPRIPLSFAAYVMIVPEDMEVNGMKPEEMVSAMAQGDYVDYLVRPCSLLLQILSGAEMDHYIDVENKSCSFDSEEFVNLLEKLSLLKDMERLSGREERAELFHAGQLPVIVEELDCMVDYLCVREAFSGSGKIAGFPNSSGETRYPAVLCDWMGINSASDYKEDAWDFIEFCIGYTSRSDDVRDRFAVTKDKFDCQSRYESNEYLSIWTNDYDTWKGGDDIAPTAQEDTERLREIAEHLYLYENQSLMQVIEEEADAFFAGDISAREAAERIQNRAALILGE